MNITVQRLHEMRTNDEEHVLLDIREDSELAVASIEGALHVPMSAFLDRLEEVPKDTPLVVMCHIGGRSAQVQNWLAGNGYDKAVNLEGGISAWSAEIDPSVPTY